jgi:hypothetical protein
MDGSAEPVQKAPLTVIVVSIYWAYTLQLGDTSEPGKKCTLSLVYLKAGMGNRKRYHHVTESLPYKEEVPLCNLGIHFSAWQSR